MTVMIADAQNGSIGRQLAEGLKRRLPEAFVWAVGTNGAAAEAMANAGADRTGAGERAFLEACRSADLILGPAGILQAGAFDGEITDAMAAAAGRSPALRVLLPTERCGTVIPGYPGLPTEVRVRAALDEAVKRLGGPGADLWQDPMRDGAVPSAPRSKKLLLTAFEPFGGDAVNASLEALHAMPERVGGWEITKAVLPVVFAQAGEKAAALAERLRPNAVLCLGQAAGRKQITPELVAINLQYARIPDNAGNTPLDRPVEPGGPAACFATLPARRMAEAMTRGGFPAALSYSAGAYVCNDLFYRMLRRFAGTKTLAGFIHVPAAADLDPKTAAEALCAALAAI